MIRCAKVSLCLVAFTFFLPPLAAADWTHWRGPTQNGVSLDTGLPDTFSTDPKAPNNNLIWTKPFGCRSTPVVMDGRVYIIDGYGTGLMEGERVICMNADTGDVIWEDKFNVFHTAIVSIRVGWTSPAGDPETGNVYVHGTQGHLRCYSRDGKIVWQHNLTEEFGRVSGYGGRIVGAICEGDLVIVGMINGSWGDYARGANRFIAFDKRTGMVVWWSPIEGQIRNTYYSTPVVATINGQRLMITGGADGALHAIQVRTGKHVWSYPFGGEVINGSPIVDGNYVYCGHGEVNDDVGELGRFVCVDAGAIVQGKPKLVWEKIGTKFAYASPTIHDGKIYLPNDSGRLFGFDAKTGKPLGEKESGELITLGTLSRGSPVWADGKIYIFDVNNHFHILKPGPDGIKRLHEQRFRGDTNSTPAIVNGKIYFGTEYGFYCIGTKDGKTGPIAPQPKMTTGQGMAQIQVVPADIVIHPGETAKFEVRYFDANGDPVTTLTATPKVDFAIVTPPKTPAGLQPPPLKGELLGAEFTADKMVSGQQGYISATVGGMTARARLRVAPVLPYKQDFEKVPVGATPGGWINTLGKFDVIDQKGNKVLRKLALNPAPPVARANAYMGLPNYHDYTLQADVSAQQVRNARPDFGIINQRYNLILDGKVDPTTKVRNLRISSWEALPRLNHSVAFQWEPDTWYTMKLVVEPGAKKDTVEVRGKVWDRTKPEPEAWTIEFTDPLPNREGCPALFAYMTNADANDKNPGAECYFDNVIITPNKATAGAAGPAKPLEPKTVEVKPLAAVEKTPAQRLAESFKVVDNNANTTPKKGTAGTPARNADPKAVEARPFAAVEKTPAQRLADSIKVTDKYDPEYVEPPKRRYVRMSGSLPGAIQVIVSGR